MDYKRVLHNRSLRIKLLRLLDWIPDSVMIRLQYKIKFGRSLNLKTPQRFTEKLQWYKLNYKMPLMRMCVDKYDVRKYVEERGLGHILNDCYGVFERFEDINFDNLPNQFVIKDTLGGGGNSVIVVADKHKLDLNKLKSITNEWLAIQGKNAGREWIYEDRKHRICIEKYIEPSNKRCGLVDYKFFCFNGEIRFMYVIADRKLGRITKLAILDNNYCRLSAFRLDEEVLDELPIKPLNFEELKQVAQILSRGFPHVRVDLYNENSKIVFGELTFFDGSGYMRFNPDSFDYILGDFFSLPSPYIPKTTI